MKILAISLLRLGDIFMHQQILHDIRKTYPEAQIDLIINSQFSVAIPLLREVTNVHLFPRETLQRELVEVSGSFFNSYRTLQTWVRSINNENYDLVFDFTHTFMSHKLVEIIDANEKRTSKTCYFNDVFSVSSSPRFHYIEALSSSLGLKSNVSVQRIDKRKNKKISIQPLTSDAKKNWNISSFQRLVEILQLKLPEYQIHILGAPFEEKILRNFFTESTKVKLDILGLQDLEFHLWDTSLLISGDTATVHLAAQTRTPVVGLYLGSADPYKTAPWIDGALVFHGSEACSPCAHSSACTQATHLCADNLSAESVSDALVLLLQNGIAGLQFEASGFPFAIYQQTKNFDGSLVLENLASLDETVRVVTGKLAWNEAFQIQNGTTAPMIADQFKEQALELAIHVKEETQLIQNQGRILLDMEEWLREVSRSLLKNNQSFDDLELDALPFSVQVNEWLRIAGDEEPAALLSGLRNEFSQNNIFSFYKKARWTLALISRYLSAKQQIYANLKSQLKERGYNYVSGPGKLS